ncbi:hypothetical protein GCM10010271_68400 [Streptomyces kurssanovii]|nr:hypothetical protein GCM10010271_68400 [Streptomyces kurssanovii]
MTTETKNDPLSVRDVVTLAQFGQLAWTGADNDPPGSLPYSRASRSVGDAQSEERGRSFGAGDVVAVDVDGAAGPLSACTGLR